MTLNGKIKGESSGLPLLSLKTNITNNVEDWMKVTVTLNNDQIKALPSTPVEIIAAPGAGKIIFVLGAIFAPNTPWVAYSNLLDGSFVQLFYSSIGSASQAFAVDDASSTATLQSLLIAGNAGISPMPLSANLAVDYVATSAVTVDIIGNWQNQPIVLIGDTAGHGDFTGGDPENTMKVAVVYTIIDL